MSPSDNSTDDKTQPITPAHLDSYLNDLFDVPSRNIESAFRLVLDLITQQSCEIKNLKKAHHEALELNDELKSRIEQVAKELADEREDAAAEFQKLKEHRDNLLASQEKTSVTVGSIQQQIKDLQAYIHGESSEDEVLDDGTEDLPSSKSSFHEPINADEQLPHVSSLTSVYVKGDSYVHSSAASQLSQPQSKELLTTSNELDKSASHTTCDAQTNDTDAVQTNDTGAAQVNDINGPSVLSSSVRGNVHLEDKSVVDNGAREEPLESTVHVNVSDGEQEATSNVERQPAHAASTNLTEGEQANDGQSSVESAGETIANQSRKSNSMKDAVVTVVAARRLAAEQTVAARLSRLESSLQDLTQRLTATDESKNDADAVIQPVEAISKITRRLSTVEQFLTGFDDTELIDAQNSDVASSNAEEKQTGGDDDSAVDNESESADTRDWSVVNPETTSNDLEKIRSLVFHLNERDSRTESSIDQLTKQIADLQNQIDSKDKESESSTESASIDNSVSKISEDLQKQLSDMASSIKDRVSKEEFIRETQSIRDILERCTSSQEPVESEQASNVDFAKLAQMSKEIDDIAKSKLNKDDFDKLMEQKESSLKSLFEGEISKQNVQISSNSEKIADVRSMIDSHLRTTTSVGQTNMNVGNIPPGDLDGMIQQATENMRASLEDSFTRRLDELKSIEDDLEGLVSQMAEKPSQDQIDSMLYNLEANLLERIGQDKDLQLMVDKMKRDLSQRMTRSEVAILVKNSLKQAKLGVQKTKDTLMIGRIPYKCIGCNQTFPAGVNGIRAPKVNHDSLPNQGLFNGPLVLHSASRKSLRPLQTLRSTPIRPSTGIPLIGDGIVPKYQLLKARNNSR